MYYKVQFWIAYSLRRFLMCHDMGVAAAVTASVMHWYPLLGVISPRDSNGNFTWRAFSGSRITIWRFISAWKSSLNFSSSLAARFRNLSTRSVSGPRKLASAEIASPFLSRNVSTYAFALTNTITARHAVHEVTAMHTYHTAT